MFVYRNGPNYWNGLPVWTLICALEYDLCTLICALEYDLCILLGHTGLELLHKAISPRNMQFRYPKIWPYCRVVAESAVTAQVPGSVITLYSTF